MFCYSLNFLCFFFKDLVNKLKRRLEESRSSAADSVKTIILTHTDSKGFTQPLSLSSEPDYGIRRKEKIRTHEKGQRIRYFADDDKYTLKEMVCMHRSGSVCACLVFSVIAYFDLLILFALACVKLCNMPCLILYYTIIYRREFLVKHK